MKPPIFSVSDLIAATNQTLEFAYPLIEVEGEVASFKVNQGKYVFFDLKDAAGSLGCFMSVWQLRQPVQDGMKVVVACSPKLTNWGKFSLTVKAIRPVGEGSIKKSFDLLREKLAHEGLFSEERKRSLPAVPQRIAVISSTQAAGYADFVRILGERWDGLKVEVAHVQVQGQGAPDQIVRALRYFNSQKILPDLIAIVRGGGSLDDLSCFNDELLVREIASSRTPTIVGVGHEVDVTLADLASDVRAATPSHAATLITPDRQEIVTGVRSRLAQAVESFERMIDGHREGTLGSLRYCLERMEAEVALRLDWLSLRRGVIGELDPERVLRRGYAIVCGELIPGKMIDIELSKLKLTAEVQHVSQKYSRCR